MKMDELHEIRNIYENLSISNQKEDSTSDLKLKTSEEISDQVNSKIISFCGPNEVEENSVYCDGPGTRTRSKMGQNSPGYIPSEFLTQVPLRTHKKKESRKCTVCGKSARSPSDLQRHMRVHTGECPFACQMCKKSFKSKRSLLNHQYLSHGVEDGLSQNRLKFLREKQMKKNPPQLSHVDQPVKIDEDEDTEIIDGHDELSFTELPVSFSGLFSKTKEEETCPQEVENNKVNTMEATEHIPNGEHTAQNVVVNVNNEHVSLTQNHASDEDSLSLPVLTKHEPSVSSSYEPRNGEILNQNVDPNNFLMMEAKTHECSHCKKQFRSVYTLRYHLRSKHGEMVYLSPALESRLKKRRWFPPYVHLQHSENKMFSTGEHIPGTETVHEAKQAFISSEQATSIVQIQNSIETPACNIPSIECHTVAENKPNTSQSSNTSFNFTEPSSANEDKTCTQKTSNCLEDNVSAEQGSTSEVPHSNQKGDSDPGDSEPYISSRKNENAEDKLNTHQNNIYYIPIDHNEAETKKETIKMSFPQNEQPIIPGSNKHFDEHFMHMSLMCLAAEARHNAGQKSCTIPSSVVAESETVAECKQKEGTGLDLSQRETSSYGIIETSTDANKRPVEASLDLCHKIKKEKLDEMSDEVNNNIEKALLNHTAAFKNSLTTEKDTKQDTYFTSSVPNQSKAVPSDTFVVDNSTKQTVVDPFVLPPQIFLPSTSASSEGSENENPISWDSIKVTSENALVTKLEAIHSITQQKFILYKCCLCGKAFSGLRIIFTHLALHNDGDKEKDCDKCGASFKWSHELDFHRECHRATERKFVPASPFLPSYYVNPFPIPVVASGDQAVMSAAGLLSYPFFPMPQQISPMMQPGFFPFFAATLQTPQSNGESSSHKSSHSSPNTESTDNFEDKSAAQSCSFQCKMCPKSFDRIFSLQRHERIHSGVKACFCKTCGRGFSELRNLRHHIVRFHADTAQREPLPYRRKPSRVRNVSSSQRLVSFLKKTAVRILNSMGQHKIDPPASSVKIQTDDTLNDSNSQEIKAVPENLSINRDELNKNKNVHEESPVQPIMNDPQHSNKINHSDDVTSTKTNTSQSDVENSTETQVNLFEHSTENTMSQLSGGNGNTVVDGECANVSETPVTHTVEVLQDPKRSLMGNRRKGRPFKLSSTSYHPLNDVFDENLSLTSNAGDDNSINCLNLSIESTGIVLQSSHESEVQETNPETSHAKYFNIESEANEPIDMRSTKDIKEEPFMHFESSKTKSENFHPNSNGLPSSNFRFDPPDAAATQSKPVLSNGGTEPKCLFPCSYCYKSFSSLSEINRHMTFHTDIRPFKCPYCSYCSRTNSQLKVHMMRHEGIKHYMCHICNYNGVTQSDLNRHLKTRTHHLRSRNVCSCCGTGFHTRSLSDEHSKTCHMNPNRDKSTTDSPNTCPPVNKGRLSRLKCTKNPDEERMKNELYQKIFDLSKMSLTFNNFLQQAAPSNTVT